MVVDVVENIQKELEFVKNSLKDRTVEMGGRLEGASFDEEDFEEAKKSLFPES